MRVVSVLPSATEIVCALGSESALVGRSSECDYPESVRRLPEVMRPRTLDSDRPSREIDARVRAARQSHESLYELDVPLLRSLRPDLLLTQDLCGVCSVTDVEVTEACRAAGVNPRIVSLAPSNLAEVWDSIETVGAALAEPTRGLALAERLRSRTRPRPGPQARVAVVEWLDPPILAGLWTPDLVEAAGAIALGPGSGEPGRRTTWAELASLSPDLVVLSPCSFSVERSRRELANPSLRADVSAVAPRLGTFVADEAYFSRPGPRLADGAELIRALLDRSGPRGPMPVESFSAQSSEAPA